MPMTNMNKILLIDPRGWQGAACGSRAYPNVGIAYLIPPLQKSGFDVKVIDLNNELLTDQQVLAITEKYKPDVIGLSVKTATMKDGRNIAQKIKKLKPTIPIVLGGPHVTIAWKELIKEQYFDIIFAGEGEQIFPQLCHNLLEDNAIENLPGVLPKCDFKENMDLTRFLISSEDLNALPFPNYDLFPECVHQTIRTGYPLVTSRGCVYKCTYCSVPLISGRKFRKRTPENIIEELKWAQKKYGIKMFEIIDDVFNLDIKRCKEICSALIDANLGLSWSCPNGLRADCVDEELAELMYKAGCHSVMVGIESADPEILANVKKGETIEDIENGINIFKNAGISVGGYFIIGLPGDSIKSQKLSVKFAKKMGIGAHFNMLVPYPGTELWDWAKANARFIQDIEDGLHFADTSKKATPVFETDDFSASERQRAYEMVNTKLRRFDLLIPGNISEVEYKYQAWRLMWKYDIVQFVLNIPKKLVEKFLRLVGM